MKVYILALITSYFLLNSSYAQKQQEPELKQVYSGLVKALKASDDQVLKDFCQQLVPDKNTLDFMQANFLCYRGIPCEMDQPALDVKSIGNSYYPNLLRVKKQLLSQGLLAKLKHVNSTAYEWEVILIVNKIGIRQNTPVSQQNYSISREKYEQAITAADSLGKTFDEFVLNGKSGKVYVIKGTEMEIRLKSGNKLIAYPIGEMVLINNRWSLFTKPNVDYRVEKR